MMTSLPDTSNIHFVEKPFVIRAVVMYGSIPTEWTEVWEVDIHGWFDAGSKKASKYYIVATRLPDTESYFTSCEHPVHVGLSEASSLGAARKRAKELARTLGCGRSVKCSGISTCDCSCLGIDP